MAKNAKKKTVKQIKAEKQRKLMITALGIGFAIVIVMMILNPPPLYRVVIIVACVAALGGSILIGKRIGGKRKDKNF